MTYKADLKHKLHKEYKNVRHPAYMNAARAVTTEVRKARRNYERKLVLNIDTDRKSFYAYVRSRSGTRKTV